MHIENSVKMLRCKYLKSQEEIAERLGVTRQTYSNYENNIKNCDIEKVISILNAIGINESDRKEFFYALEQDILSHK